MSNSTPKPQFDEDKKARIEYGWRVLQNVQELIRLMDQKSSFGLVIVGLFSAAAFTLVNAYLGKDSDMGKEKYIVIFLAFWYLFHIGQVFWHAILTLRARPNLLGNNCNAPEMIFPLMLLRRFHSSDSQYLESLSQLQPDKILADYSQQIMENSNIYVLKQYHVNQLFQWLRWSALPWFIGIVIIMANRILPVQFILPKIYILLFITLVLVIVGVVLILRVQSKVDILPPSERERLGLSAEG